MDLKEIEEVVNAHALKVAEKLNLKLKADDFHIHLVLSGAHETQLKRGTCVHIYTKLFPTDPQFNQSMRDWLRQVPKLLSGKELVLRGDVFRWKRDNRKLVRAKGLDEDLIPALLPMYRLKIEVVTTVSVTVTDKISGEKMVMKGLEQDYTRILDEARMQLSAKVRPETEDDEESPDGNQAEAPNE